MSKWSEYYKDRVGEGYRTYVEKRYASMIEELIGFRTYKEEGCGIGTISKIIKRQCSQS